MEGSGYSGLVFLEKMRFLHDITESDSESETDTETKKNEANNIKISTDNINDDISESENEQSSLEQARDDPFGIYDPSMDPPSAADIQVTETIEAKKANWFWHFMGCAERETNLFYTQKADGILGVMSSYEGSEFGVMSNRDNLNKDIVNNNVRNNLNNNNNIFKDSIVFNELQNIVKDTDMSKTPYHSSNTPSIIGNLYSQGKITSRRFSICLGYNSGFMNFDGWNSRTLRIMNYNQIEGSLIHESRVLLRRLDEKARKGEFMNHRESDAMAKLQELAGIPIQFDAMQHIYIDPPSENQFVYTGMDYINIYIYFYVYDYLFIY